MLTTNNVYMMNLDNAIRGARNPLNSWERSDSYWEEVEPNNPKYILGPNDLDLATRLRKAGPDHRKFMRQIFVTMDITAPLYWWKEFDTYKVGTCANSCSTMHTIHKKEFELSDFSFESFDDDPLGIELLKMDVIGRLNWLRSEYLKTNDKKYWLRMIQFLPSSFNQMRTVTMTYENIVNMYHARKNHKLDEWHQLCRVFEGLPYANELILNN